MRVFRVTDEELDEVMGEGQLIAFAKDQQQELDPDDYVLLSNNEEKSTEISNAKKILNLRGFEVEELHLH